MRRKITVLMLSILLSINMYIPAFALEPEEADPPAAVSSEETYAPEEASADEQPLQENEDTEASDAEEPDAEAAEEDPAGEAPPEEAEAKDTLTEEEPSEAQKTPSDGEKEEDETVYALEYSGSGYSVSVASEQGFREGTQLKAEEITPDDERYDDYLLGCTDVSGKNVGLSFRKILDISLCIDGEEVEPDETVSVIISLDESLDDVKVVHFEGETEEPSLIDADVSGSEIGFETDSFSAYAIISGPEPEDIGFRKVEDPDALSTGGFYISHTAGYFMKDESYVVKGTRTGILKTALGDDQHAEASIYHFEPAPDGKYYISCQTGSEKKYIKNTGNNSLSFSSSPETAFTVEMTSDGKFRIHNGDWYINMQGGTGGKGFAAYNNAEDVNSQLYIWTYEEPEEDPYGLTGESHGLMRYSSGNYGKALMAEESGDTLAARMMQVMTSENDRDDRIYVPKGSDITKWSFEWVRGTEFYVKAGDQYLTITDGHPALTDTPSTMMITAGSGDHENMIRLSSGSYTLKYSGSADGGFTADRNVTDDSWLYLVDETEVTPEYRTTYTAEKVSVSDTDRVPDGAQVIVYTRQWNPSTKKYELFAIDHDGGLVPCNDAGDTIQWIGPAINTLLWDFTEYHFEGTDTPNHYYELKNAYSGKYMAPQIGNDQVLSDGPIGINLNGRRYNEYYTTIVAWDDPHYTYAALAAENSELKTTSLTHASDFYFAVMSDNTEDVISTVNTLDNNDHGITMKLINYDTVYKPSDGSTTTSQEQQDVLGDNTGGTNVPPRQGLLSTNLDSSGYPVSTVTGRSLGDLYSGARTVNHLFMASTYNSTGYFEYDSTQNFASIQSDNNFRVYKELGTCDVGSRPSLKHGQFLPFNDITPNKYSTANPENLYDATLNELPDSDPRKYERLHSVGTPDYYFGLEVSASFVQTPSGLDNWGHDIIYEFTGDDDFWLYVDGELIIDLGGIHSALPGSVNYSTGQVRVNGRETTLYEIFRDNYMARNPQATAQDTENYLNGIFEQNEKGQYLFKDYTSHEMKIFFMERGGGASNLHMKFNLASVKPGQIILNKQISGTENPDYRLSDYGYQIYYQLEEDGPYYLLDNIDSHQKYTVTYQNTDTPVKFRRTYHPAGSASAYNNVFFLNPKQSVAISLPDDTFRYKIVEVGVNTQVYDEVKINDVAAEGTDAGTNRKDYATEPARVADRQRVVFDNHVSSSAERTLTVTKTLVDINGDPVEDDPTGFNFRLFLGTESDDEPVPADSQDYHVKNPDGEYCVWDTASQSFVSTNKDDYSLLTAEEKTRATFQTSPNGGISKIPAGYKVEVRGLLVGTLFKVEERRSDIPEGYTFVEYNREGDSYIQHGDEVNSGTIRDNESPAIEVVNRRGFGFTMKKEWSDKTYVKSHGRTFFGIYAGETLVDVKCLQPGSDTLYWYFDELASGKSISDYEIKELTLDGDYTVDGEKVTGSYEVTAIEDGEKLPVDATLKDDTTARYLYTATYIKGQVGGQAQNTRTDKVLNSRHGIRFVKQDAEGNPLQGAVFTLKDRSGNNVGQDHYTSDESGLITIA